MKGRGELFDTAGSEKLTDARRGIERFRDTNFASVRERLNARSDVHGLAEIVEVLVQGDGDRRAAMSANL